MKKALIYRLFKIGDIPQKLRNALESEKILVSDEGMGGLYITENFSTPGRSYVHQKEAFPGR